MFVLYKSRSFSPLVPKSNRLAISRPANRHGSAICFIGGLTFCGDSKQLQIPNLIAAERFGNATLDRLKLRLEDVDLASWNIVSSGNVRQAFALYKRTMEIRDVGDSDFKKRRRTSGTLFTTRCLAIHIHRCGKLDWRLKSQR
jgi:hypothetical protein